MNFKRILSSALAIATVVSSLTVTSVFAGDPTFTVGQPIDALTGDTVTEFTPGQIIEVPVDIENVDSGKLSMAQLRMHFDTDIFDPGIDTTDESSDGYTYYGMYTETLFAMSPQDEANEIYKVVCRNNMQGRTKGTISGNCYYGGTVDGGYYAEALLWTITGASSVAVSDSVPEFYFCFTVKSDYDPNKLALNYGTNTLTNDGLFALNGVKVDETTTNNHPNITGVQNGLKANACYGAFEVSVDDAALAAQKIWVSEINANVYTDSTKATKLGTTPLEVYTNENDTTVYKFPTRVTANAADVSSAYVEVVATLSDADGNATGETKVLAAKTISMDSTVTSYDGIAGTSDSGSGLGDGGSED